MFLAQLLTSMKNIALLSLSAVLVTASLTLVFGNASLYVAVSSLFLLLIAVQDYGPKRQRIRARSRVDNRNVDTHSSTQPLRLAA